VPASWYLWARAIASSRLAATPVAKFYRALRPALQAEDVHRPARALRARTRPAAEKQRGGVRQHLGLHEELAESRVGQIVRGRREDDLGIARHLDLARPVASIGHSEPPHLGVVFGRNGDLEQSRDSAFAAPEARHFRLERREVVEVSAAGRRTAARRQEGRTPDLAAPHVTQVDRLAGRIARGVVAESGHRLAAMKTGAAAGVGDHHRVAAVGEELRMREAGVRRPQAPQGHRRSGRRNPRRLGRARLGHGRLTRNALLQQQLGRPDARVGVEASHHALTLQGVGERDEPHPLVVRHVGPDDLPPAGLERRRRAAFRRLGGPGASGAIGATGAIRAVPRLRTIRGVAAVAQSPAALREVDRFVEAVLSVEPEPLEAPEIPHRRLGLDRHRERRGVGCDDQVVPQSALQSEPGNPERLILIVVEAIHGAERRFADAPGDTALGGVAALQPDRHPAAALEQRLGIAPHQELRHEVLEHRGGPRQQRRRAVHSCDQAAEVEPVRLRNLAPGDRDEAREPGFRRQQVVVRRIELARDLGLSQAITDREQAPFPVVEEVEPHLVRERSGAPGELLQEVALRRRLGVSGRELSQTLGEADQRPDQIAAVDGRHVARRESFQGLRVVPVEQVAFVTLELRHRIEGPLGALHQFVGIDEAQIVRRQRREQAHADVGRRCPMGDPGLGDLLEIVRRQPVFRLSRESREKAPGLARHAFEIAAILAAQLDRRRRDRTAQPIGENRRHQPEREQRSGHRQRPRPHRGHQREAQGGDPGTRRHLAVEPPVEGAPAAARRASGGERSGGARRRRCGGLPLEEPAPRHPQPYQGDGDRVHHLPRLVGEERELQPEACGFGRELARDTPQTDDPGLVPVGPGKNREQQRIDRPRQREDDEGGPGPGTPGQESPARDQKGERGRRHEAPAEIVEDLETRDERQAVALDPAGAIANPGKEPAQDLPVAPHPPVLAPGMREDARRIVVDQLDVGHQGGAGVNPFEQVVREQRVLGHPAGERRAESVDVVEPLAGEDPLAEQILVGVGDRGGVGVDSGVPGVEAREKRARRARQGDAHPRLEDAEALGDPAQLRIEVRPVQRMRDDAHQGPRRVARQPRVGVERDAVAHAGQQVPVADDLVERRIRRPAQQPVQLLELAALALPPHEGALAGIPEPPAMQEKEAPAGRIRIARVQRLDPGARRGDDRFVPRHRLGGGVDEVAQDREVDAGIEIAQREHFDVLDHLLDIGDLGEEGRYDDQGASRRGDAGPGVDARQALRRDEARHQALHDRDRKLGGRQEEKERRPQQGLERRGSARRERHTRGDQRGGERGDGPEVERRGVGEDDPARPQASPGPVRDVGFELEPSLADQVIADVRRSLLGARRCGGSRRVRSGPRRILRRRALQGLAGALHGPQRGPQLSIAVLLRELLHRPAIAVPAQEIHPAIDPRRVLLQSAIDEAHGLEVGTPVERRHETQAADHVGDRDLRRRLALVLRPDDLFGARVLLLEIGVDRAPDRGEAGSALADPLEELDEIGGMQIRRQPGELAVPAFVDAVDEGVGGPPGGARLQGAGGEPAQILDQAEAQHAGPGPELADGERRDRLEAVQEAQQPRPLEPAVAVANELDRQGIDPRRTAVFARGELRELAEVAARQILADAANLRRDDVVVVEDPFAGLGHELAAMDVFRHHPVGGLEKARVVVQARVVALRDPSRRRVDGESRRERLGALLELLDARQLVAERTVELFGPPAQDPVESGVKEARQRRSSMGARGHRGRNLTIQRRQGPSAGGAGEGRAPVDSVAGYPELGSPLS
jgi:hypothetical protein